MNILQYKKHLTQIATSVKTIDEAYDLAYETDDFLLEKAIYSAMDEVETYAKEQRTHMSEQFEHYIATIKNILDCAEDYYGYDFVKLASLRGCKQ